MKYSDDLTFERACNCLKKFFQRDEFFVYTNYQIPYLDIYGEQNKGISLDAYCFF